MLAECLSGRIRYNCASYVGMDGCRIFEIFIDNNLVKQFSLETVNSYFIISQYSAKRTNLERTSYIGEYWEDFWDALEQFPMKLREEYTDVEFCEALEKYRNQSVKESINSDNPLVRMFAILDRRVGKRTLLGIKDTVNQQPEWLQVFYRLRLEADSI